MAEKSKIGWTDNTFNPWWGCEKVSEGCQNCYAETFANRCHPDKHLWKPGSPRLLMKDSYWNQPRKWNSKAEQQGIRPFVFCGSMCDICDSQAPDGVIKRLFDLIRETPNLFWLLLTKRPERFPAILPADWRDGWDNVMLMTTCENQARADERIPILLHAPCRYRGISIEPMLGPIHLNRIEKSPLLKYHCQSCEAKIKNKKCPVCGLNGYERNRIDWVIVGGESGPNARPMHPDWARSIRDKCAETNTPFFFKQWGEYGSTAIVCSTNEPTFFTFQNFNDWVNHAQSRIRHGDVCIDTAGNSLQNGKDFMEARDANRFPVVVMRNVGKKAAGDLLDGKQYHEFPSTGIPHTLEDLDELERESDPLWDFTSAQKQGML